MERTRIKYWSNGQSSWREFSPQGCYLKLMICIHRAQISGKISKLNKIKTNMEPGMNAIRRCYHEMLSSLSEPDWFYLHTKNKKKTSKTIENHNYWYCFILYLLENCVFFIIDNVWKTNKSNSKMYQKLNGIGQTIWTRRKNFPAHFSFRDIILTQYFKRSRKTKHWVYVVGVSHICFFFLFVV